MLNNKSLALSVRLFFIVILLFQTASPALAAGLNKHDPMPTFTSTASPTSTLGANVCSLYPIAVSAQSLQGISIGGTLNDIYNGSQPGNPSTGSGGTFGWLSWTGDQSAPALATSLTPPGNSSAYVNPNNLFDHQLSIGDWVQGKAGVSNSSSVRNALDQLKTMDIDLPVWDIATGNGSNTQYHIVNFVRMRITDYQLPSQNRISARFLGYSCGNNTPTVTLTTTATPTVTNSASLTKTMTVTSTITLAATNTTTPTSTDTNTVTPTVTGTITDTATATETETSTPTLTFTPYPSPTGTMTDTATPTITDTATSTSYPTGTMTDTATPTPSPTGTMTDTSTLTPTFTPTDTATSTPSITPSATSTKTSTATLQAGISCIDWRDGDLQGWVQSPWTSASAEIRQDANGVYGYAANPGSYQVGMYFQLPASGAHKLLFGGQHLAGISVAQGANAPGSAAPLGEVLTAHPDGSYSVTASYVEVRWTMDGSDLSNAPLFTSFCYGAFTPTATRTLTATVTAAPTSTLTPTSTPECQSWDLARDFRPAPDQENPNRDTCGNLGVWSFMKSASLVRDPATYSLLPNFTANFRDTPGINTWTSPSTSTSQEFPVVGFNASGVTQIYGYTTWQPNTIWAHPGSNELAVIAWKSPVHGYVSINGRVSDICPNNEDGILWYIDRNTSGLTSGSISNGGTQGFDQGAGGANLNSVAVNIGDVIYLAIHPNGSYGCDSTRVDLSINVVTAPTPTLTPTATLTCQMWNLAHDFRTAPDQENPNRDSCGNLGVWSFMQSSSLTRNPITYSLLPNFAANFLGIPGVNTWANPGTYPFIGFNSGATQTYYTTTIQSNSIWAHPGPSNLAIIAWKSPIDGHVKITGSVKDQDATTGDGILWFIDKNTTNLTSGGVYNGGSQDFSNDPMLNTVAVSAGDIIYLAIHPNGSYDYDPTQVDLSIAVTSAPTPTATPPACQNWDLARDFRPAPDQENPNRDSCGNLRVWNFMGSPSLALDPQSYYLLSNFTGSFGGVTGVNVWSGAYADSNGRFPIFGFNNTGATQPYIWAANTVLVHPGPNQLPVIAWRSPINGYVAITGGVSDYDPNCGDGIVWYMNKNTTSLASGGYPNGGSQTYANANGGPELGAVPVSIGDMLYLAIHPYGNYICDATRVDLSISVTTAPTPTPTPVFNFSGLNVFVGYADSLRGTPNFPVPWQGAPNTLFLGSGAPYDGGAIRLENTTDQAISVQSVTASFPNHSMFNGAQEFNLWGAFTIPAHSSTILTQTTQYDFDTSDYGIPGINCGAPAAPSNNPPQVTVVLADQSSSTMTDSAHVLDTGGRDLAACNNSNEALQWQAIGVVGGNTIGNLVLNPTLSSAAINGSTTLTAQLSDPSNQLSLSNVAVDFAVLSGPNAGQTGHGVTDNQGLASFTYSGTQSGADTVQASVTNLTGGSFSSNQVTVNWAPATPTPTITPTATPTHISTPTSTPTATTAPPQPLVIPGWIGSPAEQSSISGIVPIKLADGVTLTDGTIDYWPVDDTSQLKVLATGLSGSGGATLASLDTTLLADDSYIIRLQGTNSSGVQQQSGVLVTVVGEYKPGRVRFTITDLTVPLAGLPIVVGRTYDSLERARSSDFGHGWNLSIGNPRLTVNQAHDVTLTMTNGKRVTWYFTPTPQSFLFLRPHYTAEPGVYGSLEAPDCALVVSAGNYFCFLQGDYQPAQYTYTDPYGRKFIIDQDGALKSITDLNDNILTFTPDGITSSLGNLNIPFVRDAQGRITQITDPEGSIYSYGYDSAGNLASVSLPGVDTPLRYHYNADHFFLDAVDPRGNTLITDSYDPDGRLQSETDALGNTWQYEYQIAMSADAIGGSGKLNAPSPQTFTVDTITVTDPDQQVNVSTYDGYGKLLSHTDELGRTTIFVYDSNHNLLSRTDALGHTISYTYNGNGQWTSFTDALHQTSYKTYNQYGGPTTQTDALGQTRTVNYDARFRPLSVSDSLGTMLGVTWDEHGSILTRADANGNTTTYTYDSYGKPLTATDALDHTTNYTFDRLGRLTSATDAANHVTRLEYDALGHITKVIEPLGKTTTYEYDANGNRTLTIDPKGGRSTYTYDKANRLVDISLPDNTSEYQYTYNWRGKILTATDPAGQVTRYQYDAAGELTSVTQAYGTADAATKRYGYDAAGRRISFIDALNHMTTFVYDAADRLLQISDPLSHATNYSYNAIGDILSTTDADHHTTSYTYTAREHLKRATYADGSFSRQTYDGNGNTLSFTDQAGNTTNYAYDAANQLLSVTDALAHTTRYEYDTVGDLVSITDANNHQTGFAYDALHRPVRKTWASGSFETLGYDLNGNVTSNRLADGNTNSYSYNALDQLTRIDYFDGQTNQFTYTPNGLRQTAVDGRGAVQYDYDRRSRLTQITQPDGQTIAYTYDDADNRRSLTTAAGTIRYNYDEANRLISVTDPSNAVTTFDHDALGLRAQKVLPNGITVDYTYDSVNRLTDIDQHNGNTVLASYAYTFDPVGNRLSVTEASGASTHWAYDDAYRLLSETRKNGSNTVTAQTAFTYDPVGNRLTQNVNGAITNYTYNNLDQLLTANSTQYQYDGRGNLTTVNNGPASTISYTYNAADRLVQATKPDGTNISNLYSVDGLRVQQSITPATGLGQTTNYLWDETSRYGDVAFETNGGNTTSYVYGGAELISQTHNDVASYYLHDGHGSVRNLADATGSLTDSYDYSAFGETTSHTGSSVNAYQYTGQQLDAQTGLYDLRARYYDPSMGRFLSRDPYGYGDPAQLNRYGYTADNPINFIDPLGLTVVETEMLDNNAKNEGAAAGEMSENLVGKEFASEGEKLLLDSANNIGEFGTGDYPQNLKYLAENNLQKNFWGMNYRFEEGAQSIMPPNTKLIPGDYTELNPPLKLDASFSFGPGSKASDDIAALTSAYKNTLPGGKIFIASTENTFAERSGVEAILKANNLNYSWFASDVGGGGQYLGFTPQTMWQGRFGSFIYLFKALGGF